MKHLLFITTKKITKAFIYLALGGAAVFLTVFVLYLEGRPDLKIWHDAGLDEEFTVESSVTNFSEYVQLEEKLFQQLEKNVYSRIEPEDKHHLNRFNHGSMSDPSGWAQNWNRTFELSNSAPKAGVLLLHGMSDSPYSLRNMGLSLNSAGAWVIGLRIPGHGTAPSGLVEMQWQDMTAAVRLAMNHLQKQVNDQPLFIIGYSNGSALAVHYALSTLDNEQLPKTDGLILVSPAIGVTKLAAFAVWQARLGHLLGLDKLAWNSIGLEYDPFKYNSFAVNAGDQVYRLTSEIQKLLTKNKDAGRLLQLPPILAFQSVVDATVSTSVLITGLFNKLPTGGHELVLFDINRINQATKFFNDDPKPYLDKMLYNSKLSYTLALITNEDETSRQVHVLRKKAGSSEINRWSRETAWPKAMHSLSHIALPFPKTDTLYGEISPEEESGLHLGNIAVRGERGVIQIPASSMLRLRWNPFYSYIEQRIFDFIRLEKE
jgi:alpha-beta hydrolase superfamily lysophospholipase